MILFPNAFIPPGLSVTSVVEARAQSIIHQAAASVATQTQEKFSGIFPIEFRPELYYVIYLFFNIALALWLSFILFSFFSFLIFHGHAISWFLYLSLYLFYILFILHVYPSVFAHKLKCIIYYFLLCAPYQHFLS